MFISRKTQEGFKISAFSAIKATIFLFQVGMQFVLTEQFWQDPAKEYVENQRKMGRRSDNPDIHAFGYNNNSIRTQRTVSCHSGNARGRKDQKRAWVKVTDDPLPCRKKVLFSASSSLFPSLYPINLGTTVVGGGGSIVSRLQALYYPLLTMLDEDLQLIRS